MPEVAARAAATASHGHAGPAPAAEPSGGRKGGGQGSGTWLGAAGSRACAHARAVLRSGAQSQKEGKKGTEKREEGALGRRDACPQPCRAPPPHEAATRARPPTHPPGPRLLTSPSSPGTSQDLQTSEEEKHVAPQNR